MTAEAVKAAISERLRSIVRPDALRQDRPNYTRSLSQNFVAGILDEDIRSDFSGGDSGELDGDPPAGSPTKQQSGAGIRRRRPPKRTGGVLLKPGIYFW